MKNQPNIIVKLLFAICCLLNTNLSAYGQSNSQINKLEGTWTFLEAPSIAKMPNDIRLELSVSTDIQEHISAYYKGRRMQFRNDGSFSILLNTGNELKGQWSIQNSSLILQDTNGGSTTYKLNFLNENNLLLKMPPDQDPNNRALFPVMYFLKN